MSKNFTISEMTYSSTAKMKGINNTPSPTVVKNLNALIDNVLQPLRDWYGKPIHVTSGYRCKALNKAVGGVATSNHTYGYAADIQGFDHTMSESKKLFDRIKTNIPFSELIWEHNKSGSYWVHVAYNPINLKHKVVDNLLKK